MAAEGPVCWFFYLGDNSPRCVLKYVMTASGTFKLICLDTSLITASFEKFSNFVSLRDVGEFGTSESIT